MKLFWLVSLLALGPVQAYARDTASPTKSGAKTFYAASPYQSEISFQSKRLPAWQFGVRYNREVPFQDRWVDTVNTYHAVDSVRISASRTILKNSSQRIFAALQTSNDRDAAFNEWIYLPTNAGTAASVGWQIGELRSVKMAVELQYREINDRDLSSLLMGVQYYF